MKRMLKKSKGFTLVELLIVVIIIGILAGMMMLSTGSATAKAEATKIVSNLRNMKAAAVMVYADSGDWAKNAEGLASLDVYLDQTTVGTSYDLSASGDFVGYKAVPTDVGKSLKNIKDLSLYQSPTSTDKYDGGATVYMKVK